jgi:hypothetical protein
MHFEDKYDMVFNVIGDFLQKEYSLSQNLFEQLMDFQKRYIVDYKSIKNYPMTKDYDYDFIGYVQGIAPLESKTTYEFDFPEDKTVSLERFCEQIFFYRRRNFGKTWITKKN